MARTRKNRTMRHKKRGGQVDSSTSSSSFSSEISPNNSGYDADADADSFSSSAVSNPLGGKRSRKHKRGGQWQSMYPQQQQSSGWFGNSQPQQSNSLFGSYQGQGSYGKKPWYQFWGGKTKKHSRRRKHGGQAAVTGFDGAWDQPATALAGGRRRRHRKH